jgi:hypothetical protein
MVVGMTVRTIATVGFIAAAIVAVANVIATSILRAYADIDDDGGDDDLSWSYHDAWELWGDE